MNRFKIECKLPTINDYTRANRSNAYAGGYFKKKWDKTIGIYINEAKKRGELYQPTNKVVINFIWHERTKKRDADNIASAKKFILDALVENEILKDDNRKFVVGFNDIIVDDTEDYVIVELLEVKNV